MPGHVHRNPHGVGRPTSSNCLMSVISCPNVLGPNICRVSQHCAKPRIPGLWLVVHLTYFYQKCMDTLEYGAGGGRVRHNGWTGPTPLVEESKAYVMDLLWQLDPLYGSDWFVLGSSTIFMRETHLINLLHVRTSSARLIQARCASRRALRRGNLCVRWRTGEYELWLV